jgi:hypothetical protein
MTSNSDAAVTHKTDQINAALHKGGQCGWQSLETHRDAGRFLEELKDIAPRGQFGRIVDELCGCDRAWSARLRYLNKNWDNILSAFAWEQSLGLRPLGRRAYSVDGAVALVHRWQKATSGISDGVVASTESHGDRKREEKDEAAPPAEAQNLRSRLSETETELAGAREDILALEHDLHERHTSVKDESWPLASGPIELDAKTKELVRRAAEQWNPRIPDLSARIETWIKARAQQFGWPVADLLRACDANDACIADYTFGSHEETAS